LECSTALPEPPSFWSFHGPLNCSLFT
jgi:hypothetical protein